MNTTVLIAAYESGASINALACDVGISVRKIRNLLVRENVELRNKGEAIRLFNKRNAPIPHNLLERIEGELLGDGCIVRGSAQSFYSFDNTNHDYAEWMYDLCAILPMSPRGIVSLTRKDKRSGTVTISHRFRTLSTCEFHALEQRWYGKDRIKRVPPDLLISPSLVLHWFLGDGFCDGRRLILCSESFSKDEQTILSKKLNAAIGCHSSLVKTRTGSKYRIFVPQSNIPTFLRYIGNPPFTSMSYKWKIIPVKRSSIVDIPVFTLKHMYIDRHMTAQEISSELSVSVKTIQAQIVRYRISRNKKSVDPSIALKLIALASCGTSINRMARELSLCPASVSWMMEELGIHK